MAAAIDKKFDERMPDKEKDKETQMSTDESIRNYIMSLVGTQAAPKAPTVQIESATATAKKPPSQELAQAKVTLQ